MSGLAWAGSKATSDAIEAILIEVRRKKSYGETFVSVVVETEHCWSSSVATSGDTQRQM